MVDQCKKKKKFPETSVVSILNTLLAQFLSFAFYNNMVNAQELCTCHRADLKKPNKCHIGLSHVAQWLCIVNVHSNTSFFFLS